MSVVSIMFVVFLTKISLQSGEPGVTHVTPFYVTHVTPQLLMLLKNEKVLPKLTLIIG